MKKTLVFLVSVAAMCGIAQSARAAGIGVYGTGGVNFTTWNMRGVSANTTDYFYGGGLVIDSNVAKNETFGYRFTAGYEQYRMKDPNSGNTSSPIHRASMSHTFGFGVARNENVRFWLGPRFGLHYLRLRDTYTDTESIAFNMYPYGQKVKVELDMIGFDALLAFGINVNMGEIATMFLDIGVGYMGNYNIHAADYGHGFGIEGKAGFMFRINDSYKQPASSGDIKMKVQDIK
jgi:hypothetical protein